MRFLQTILLISLLCAALSAQNTEPARPHASTWSKQETGAFTRLMGVHFIDSQRGWVVGSTGTLFGTANGGKTWEKVALPVRESKEMIRDLWAFDAQKQLLLGDYNKDMHPVD